MKRSHVAVVAEGLSKRYRLGASARLQTTFREQMTGALERLFRRRSHERAPEFWALRDVSLEVKQGEILGIVGRNGAGKSTLLKILARITEPTTGQAEVRGRLGSLLEVGTGFHPELSGRENVFLSGALLGMKRREIECKFDEIVAFAEIERFIDTPVKRYSSGMYVRLAFAVAAHLEPDILLVDEVLAVGDFAFQRKCLGKLQSEVGSGRTVLFISHSLGAIRTLCTRCVLLEEGRLVADGTPDAIVERYVENDKRQRDRPGPVQPDEGGGFVVYPRKQGFELTISCGEPVVLEFDVEAETPPVNDAVSIGVKICTPSGDWLISMDSIVQRGPYISGSARRWTVQCDLGHIPLNAGTYFIWIYANVYELNTVRRFARFSRLFALHVLEADVFGWGATLPSPNYWGPVYWVPEWDIRPAEVEEGEQVHPVGSVEGV